jgi:hypothetical protein
VAGLIAVGWLTRGWATTSIGESLVCQPGARPADAILVDNLDSNYLLFERAAALQRAGLAPTVFIPVQTSSAPVGTSVSEEIVDVMVRKARVRDAEQVRVDENEPVSLSVAHQIADVFETRKVKSVILVTPGFRSRRTTLVYQAVLQSMGIDSSCVPVFGARDREEWTRTWHGIQDVALQFVKLQYYRLYVLPTRRWS